jgi:crossover junction endodeoxyribonuclease RuvC
MKSLGLDISTKTGAVVLEGSKPSVVEAKLIHHPKETGLERCSAIAGGVLELAYKHKPEIVVLEGYGYANTNSLVTLVEIGTVIRYFLRQEGFPFITVAPAQLKKFVLGKGVGKKDEVRLGVFKRWGFEHKSDDVVDAFGLSAIGLAQMGELIDVTAKMREVLQKLDA